MDEQSTMRMDPSPFAPTRASNQALESHGFPEQDDQQQLDGDDEGKFIQYRSVLYFLILLVKWIMLVKCKLCNFVEPLLNFHFRHLETTSGWHSLSHLMFVCFFFRDAYCGQA
jgi:hypothetical protein